MATQIRVENISDAALNATNCVYCSEEDFKQWIKLGSLIRLLGENPFYAYKFVAHRNVMPGTLAMNQQQRQEVFLARNDVVKIEILNSVPVASLITMSITFKVKRKDNVPRSLEAPALVALLHDKFNGHALTIGQKVSIKHDGVSLAATVQNMIEKTGKNPTIIDDLGLLTKTTDLHIVSPPDSGLKIVGISAPLPPNFLSKDIPKRPPLLVDIPLDKMGLGGLGKEFRTIFRRAFASRCLDPMEANRLGIKHVKGILLYGPPGTGKTLLAHTIGHMLNTRKPKTICASEILSKWVGEGDKRVRELFVDAEKEFAEKGDMSELHLVIIDELDAICRQRSSSTTNQGDTIVNQLLEKMDGSTKITNILVIGMTNRKDLIDKAFLRPGRFEVHLEVGLPTEKGREEILNIHTRELREEGRLESTISLDDYSKKTKNFTGAELAGMVRSATSFALERGLDMAQGEELRVTEDKIQVKRIDFDRALQEIEPSFGVSRDRLAELVPQCGFITWSDQLNELLATGQSYIARLESSPVLRITKLLISGPPGSGKTTIAARLAEKSDISMVKVVAPEDFVGMADQQIAAEIKSIFRDLYRSGSSLLILDNIERLISYSSINTSTISEGSGPIRLQYSNVVLQALMVFGKKQPPPGRRVAIIGTSSDVSALKMLGLLQIFDKNFEIPLIETKDVTSPSTIHQVLLDLDNSRMSLSPEKFATKLKSLGPAFENLGYLQSPN